MSSRVLARVVPACVMISMLLPWPAASQSGDSTGSRAGSPGPQLEETKTFLSEFLRSFSRIGKALPTEVPGLWQPPDQIAWSACKVTLRITQQYRSKYYNLTLKYHPLTVTMDLSLLQPITSIARDDSYEFTRTDAGTFLVIDSQLGKAGIVEFGGNWNGKPKERTVPREWFRFQSAEDALRAQRAFERALMLCGAKATPY